MEKKYIHYKKVEGNFGIEIDESVAKKYIKLKKEIARLEKELAPIENKLKEDSIDVLSKLEEKKFTSNDINITYITMNTIIIIFTFYFKHIFRCRISIYFMYSFI